jgi:hypothetical protein
MQRCAVSLALACVFLAGSANSSSGDPFTVTVTNNGVPSPVTCVGPPNIPPPFECNERANIVVGGGFTQRSGREVVVENNPSDLVLSNFRIRSDVDNAGTFTKVISASGYTSPEFASVAWHTLFGSVTLLGPMGAFAQITVDGTVDGVPTAGVTTKVFKTGTALVYNFAAASEITKIKPPTPRPHTRVATYTFLFGGGALANSEIRFPSSGHNPFATPEPGSLFLMGSGLAGMAFRARRKRNLRL